MDIMLYFKSKDTQKHSHHEEIYLWEKELLKGQYEWIREINPNSSKEQVCCLFIGSLTFFSFPKIISLANRKYCKLLYCMKRLKRFLKFDISTSPCKAIAYKSLQMNNLSFSIGVLLPNQDFETRGEISSGIEAQKILSFSPFGDTGHTWSVWMIAPNYLNLSTTSKVWRLTQFCSLHFFIKIIYCFCISAE